MLNQARVFTLKQFNDVINFENSITVQNVPLDSDLFRWGGNLFLFLNCLCNFCGFRLEFAFGTRFSNYRFLADET